MNIKTHNKLLNVNTSSWALVFLLMLLCLFPEFSWAQVPTLTTSDLGLPGVDANTPVVKKIAYTIGFFVFIFVIAALGFGLSQTIATFFRELNDARKNGEWGPIIQFAIIAIIVVVFVFVIIGYITDNVINPINTL